MAQEPGWYHAEGDPAGTQRYWDGSQWVGDPVGAAPAGGGSQDRYGTAGARLGARIVDAIVIGVPIVILMFMMVDFDDNNTAQLPIGFLLVAMILAALYEIGMVATTGATIGKRVLGLKVIGQDGTSPPGWGPAALRWAPAVAGIIPGAVGGLIGIGLAIASGVMISSDDHRRSVQDRVGTTYVIKT